MLAADLFNGTWALMEKPSRTADEDETMVHMAHASRFHWQVAGGPVQRARGEWQLARVYALVGRAEPALWHAARCLELCEAHRLGAFDLAFAYEALSRAEALDGRAAACERHRALAIAAAEAIEAAPERQWLLDNVATIPRL